MKDKYKILLIFPPPASPVSPYLSTPLLAGQLKAAGYDVKSLDLSVEFFYYILNSEFLKNSYKNAKEKFFCLKNAAEKLSLKDSTFCKIVEKNLEEEQKNLEIIDNIDNYLKKYKSYDSFYDIETMDYITQQINKAFEIAMLPYFPAYCAFNVYKNPLYKVNFGSIKYQTTIKTDDNVFYEFYKKKIKEHNIDKYDFVCITCPNETQIIPALTLTAILKKTSNIKISIGGNIISRIDEELKNMPEAFDIFYDYVMAGLGEKTIVQLADYLSGKNDNLSNIKGLIYKKNGKIISKKPDLKYNINNAVQMCLDGLSLEKYFTPDIIMPIQSSKGCYWGKCLFCGLHYPPKKYTVKNPKKVVDEIEFLNKEYNIKIFEFVDEALHPAYLSKLADEIIKRKLDIKYVCCARLEDNLYSQELCRKLYKSGLRLVEFGFETASERIYKLLNKGIKFENRLNAISLFAKAGIFTYVYAIIGYPSETRDEAITTLSCAKKHEDIIDTLFIHNFWLDKKAPAFKKYKCLGISEININEKDCFSQGCDFMCDNGMKKEEIDELADLNLEDSKLKKHIFFAPDEYFFLYALYYGRQKLRTVL